VHFSGFGRMAPEKQSHFQLFFLMPDISYRWGAYFRLWLFGIRETALFPKL